MVWRRTVVVDEDGGQRGHGLHAELQALVEVLALQQAAQRVLGRAAREHGLLAALVAAVALPGDATGYCGVAGWGLSRGLRRAIAARVIRGYHAVS